MEFEREAVLSIYARLLCGRNDLAEDELSHDSMARGWLVCLCWRWLLLLSSNLGLGARLWGP